VLNQQGLLPGAPSTARTASKEQACAERMELQGELAGQLSAYVGRFRRQFALDDGLQDATLAMGLEGVVAKRVDAPYPSRQPRCQAPSH
jgi:hypothetical protein